VRRPLASILLGGLVVGSLDAAFAIAFWVPRGSTPSRIFQSVAAGLLGRASFQRGMTSVLLGVFLHYFVATTIVFVYWLFARRMRILREHPIACGALYGIGAYLFMNYVVIPLSATARGRFNLWWVVSSVIVHALLIGVPAALFARRAVA
jgi:uncharacterized membrane protein YagU involved in acid resistance